MDRSVTDSFHAWRMSRRLLLLLDQRLGPAKSQALEKHVSDCEVCTEERQRWERMRHHLAVLKEEPAEVPAHFRAHVLAGIDGQPARADDLDPARTPARPAWLWVPVPVLAAGLLVAVFYGALPTNDRRGGQTTDDRGLTVDQPRVAEQTFDVGVLVEDLRTATRKLNELLYEEGVNKTTVERSPSGEIVITFEIPPERRKRLLERLTTIGVIAAPGDEPDTSTVRLSLAQRK